jgi:hypothetical protein
VDGHAGPVGEEAHGVGEVQVLGRLHETDGIARDLAAEAVVEPLLGVHTERGRLLGVEGAQPHPAPTLLAQGGMLPDQRDDVGRRPYPGHVLVGDGHGR